MRQNREQLFCWATLLALWALFHHRILFQGHTEVLLDASRFFYPLWAWGATVWQQGLIPLWNPDAAFGTPYLADPEMAGWYPPLMLAYHSFSPVIAFSFLTVSHHLWALVGFFLFARNRSFSPVVALGGVVVFGFSFNAVSLAWMTSILFTFSWIPWVFLAADRLRKGKAGSVLLLMTVFAMQLAAGYPLYAYLTGLMVAGDWVLREWLVGEKEVRGGVHQLAWALLAAALGIFYNAAWLIPLKEMIPYSNLSQRLSMPQGMAWGNLVTWLNPFAKGHPLLAHPGTPFSYTVYFVGLPTLVLILWGIVKGKVQKYSLALFVVVFVLSLGEMTYIGALLKQVLPGYGLVVRSGYWISFVVFMAAVLLMEATQAIVSEKRWGGVLWVGISVFLYGAALVAGIPWDLWTFWASLFLLFVTGLGNLSPRMRPILVTLALIFSVGPVARSIHFTMNSSYYDTKPLAMKGLARPGRVYHSAQRVDALETISGKSVEDVYGKLKESMAPNWPLGLGWEEVGFSNPLFLKSYLNWYLQSSAALLKGHEDVLDHMNVRYSFDEMKGRGWQKLTIPGCPVPLWENRKVFPKWFSALGPGSSPRIVEESLRTPNRVDLTAKGGGETLLVSSEMDYPGWWAKVGDQLRPVSELDDGFRSLILGAEEEKVSMVFRPTSFRLGCFISLLVCGIWMGMILGLTRKHKNA